MIPIPTGVRVWPATGHTDMRKGFASFSLQVQEVLCRDPQSGRLFCFRGPRGDLLKVIWHNGQGACLFTWREVVLYAVAGGRRGVDLAGTDELSFVRHRLAQSPGVLASNQRGLRVCRLNLAANMIPFGHGLRRRRTAARSRCGACNDPGRACGQACGGGQTF